MIDFMLISLPRSGSTWAANWLTTDSTLCLHDPLFRYHYDQLDSIESKHSLGISCTGIYNWPEWINKHPARKVILHRNLDEINASLAAIGLPNVGKDDEKRLSSINGMHLDWRAIFDEPKPVFEFLTGREFEAERHEELRHIEMQPLFSGLKIDQKITARLIAEMKEQ